MDMTRLRRAVWPISRPLLHFYWRWSRPATLGARAMVIDGRGRVFLVKHSYVDGWHLPGGGVEAGETMLAALARELAEEGNIELTAIPKLHALYFNKRASRRASSIPASRRRCAASRKRVSISLTPLPTGARPGRGRSAPR